MEYNFHNGQILNSMANIKIYYSIKAVSYIFVLDLTISKILTFEIFDLEKVDQDLKVTEYIIPNGAFR